MNNTHPNVVTNVSGEAARISKLSLLIQIICARQWKYTADESSVKYNNDILVVCPTPLEGCWIYSQQFSRLSNQGNERSFGIVSSDFSSVPHYIICPRWSLYSSRKLHKIPFSVFRWIRDKKIERRRNRCSNEVIQVQIRGEKSVGNSDVTGIFNWCLPTRTLAAFVFLNWDGSISACKRLRDIGVKDYS